MPAIAHCCALLEGWKRKMPVWKRCTNDENDSEFFEHLLCMMLVEITIFNAVGIKYIQYFVYIKKMEKFNERSSNSWYNTYGDLIVAAPTICNLWMGQSRKCYRLLKVTSFAIFKIVVIMNKKNILLSWIGDLIYEIL